MLFNRCVEMTADFNVDTPSGLVSVHGTLFDVDVVQDGEVLFAVTHGKVQVKNDLSEVFLLAGQATSALPGADIEQPGYQFMLNGQVELMQDDLWQVNGIQFNSTSSTEISRFVPD